MFFDDLEPTCGGLLVLCDFFRREGWELPDLRLDVVRGAMEPDEPLMYRSRQGFSAGPEVLAKENPFAPATNVALFSKDGRYGLFFVREQLISREQRSNMLMLPPMTFSGDVGGSSYLPLPQTTNRMRVYDEDGEFAREVASMREHILLLARFGRVNISFLDWAKFLVHSKKYHFPLPASRQAA
jgi:hypothetical protein